MEIDMDTKRFFREALRHQRLPLADRTKALSPLIAVQYFSRDSMNGLTYEPVDTRSGYLHHHDGRRQSVICFATNDYLGCAIDPAVIQAAMDATARHGVSFCGSVALNGTNPLLNTLEAKIAKFKGAEDSIVFPSGFSANYGWISSICRKTDLVYVDEYVHTSVNEGLARQLADQNVTGFRHLDAEDLATKLEAAKSVQDVDRYVVIEGVYSMHGTIPDIEAFARVAHAYGAYLIVDDAHGTGTVGRHGRGCHMSAAADRSPDLVVGTLSKAVGCVGGFIAGAGELINLIRTRATPLLFSAVPPPSVLAAAAQSIDIITTQPERFIRLRSNVSYARQLLAEVGVDTDCDSPILSVLLPPAAELRTEVYRIREAGVFLNGVEFPAIPLGEKRLRISINAKHTHNDIEAMADQVKISMRSAAA
jgi:glycine C-acetyltransferase